MLDLAGASRTGTPGASTTWSSSPLPGPSRVNGIW